MFIGSGMPRNLWTRVAERFPDARILEFYASAEGEAILANLTGQKPGSMGKRLPGTAEVRVAAFDLAKRTARAHPRRRRPRMPRRRGRAAGQPGAPGDGRRAPRCAACSRPTTRGARPATCSCATTQGDHWLAGSVAEVVETAHGPVLPAGTRFCLGNLPGSDLVVAYGVRDGDEEVLVGALTVLPGTEVDAARAGQGARAAAGAPTAPLRPESWRPSR